MMPTVLDYCIFLGRSTSTTQPTHDADKKKNMLLRNKQKTIEDTLAPLNQQVLH